MLYLASRDPRVAWHTKLLASVVLAYALSPLDLIPDFVPILGYLDDAVIIPLGVVLVRKAIPAPLLAEFRAQAIVQLASATAKWVGTGVVVLTWVAAAVLAFYAYSSWLR